MRIRNDKQLVTDGPFAETQEQLGGYYLVEARDLNEAIGIAARIPSVRFGHHRGQVRSWTWGRLVEVQEVQGSTFKVRGFIAPRESLNPEL